MAGSPAEQGPRDLVVEGETGKRASGDRVCGEAMQRVAEGSCPGVSDLPQATPADTSPRGSVTTTPQGDALIGDAAATAGSTWVRV